jgi:FtsZ-binding cell division protein ZapB
MIKNLDNLTKRVAWSIETIKIERSLDKGIKDIDLAKILGTNKNTLSDYRKEKGLLKSVVVENLVSVFNFNPMWLFKGVGEPFPGAREKYPDVCGPETINKTSPLYNKVEAPDMYVATPGIEYNAGTDDFGKAVSGLKKIFDSGDPILTATSMAGIHIFETSLNMKAQINEQTKKIDGLQKECDDLKDRIGSLEKHLTEVERRRRERRQENQGPPNGVERRSGSDRRKCATGG